MNYLIVDTRPQTESHEKFSLPLSLSLTSEVNPPFVVWVATAKFIPGLIKTPIYQGKKSMVIPQDLNLTLSIEEALSQFVGTTGSDFIFDVGAQTLIGDASEDISNKKRGHDLIIADEQANLIFGDTSARIVNRARGGHDLILGRAGVDKIRGDALILTDQARGGNDGVFGGLGNDILEGDASNLFEKSSGGNDSLFGDEGDDILRGDASEMRGRSKGGDDILFGGIGNDQLFGDAVFLFEDAKGGNDILVGGEGDDVLHGDSAFSQNQQAGHDVLIGVNPKGETPGMGEFDELFGGGGSDCFVLGDARMAYYIGALEVDHGLIHDFNLSEQDIIQLHGRAADYELKDFSLGQFSGVDIFLKGSNELIGSVLNTSTETLSLESRAFDYVS